MKLDKAKYAELYESMLRIRRFEETAIDVFSAGKIPGFIHSYIGQEAIAVGVCAALEPTDYITGTHRGRRAETAREWRGTRVSSRPPESRAAGCDTFARGRRAAWLCSGQHAARSVAR